MSASKKFPSLPSNWTESFLLVNDSLSLRIWKKNKIEHCRWLHLVHGQSEQGDRYEHFPSYLNTSVDIITCLDLPGHGKSKGKRGHINHFNEYVQAVLVGFQEAKKIAENWGAESSKTLEAHWFGHSLGGLISLAILLEKRALPLKSVTLCAPFLELAFPPPPIKLWLAKMIAPFWGSLKLSNELKPEDLSHDKSVVDYINQNPQNHSSITPRAFLEMQRINREIRNSQHEFPYNLMIVLPMQDPICKWQTTFNFFQNLKMPEGKIKKLNSFPGFYHESFNELGKERVFNALESWLQNN